MKGIIAALLVLMAFQGFTQQQQRYRFTVQKRYIASDYDSTKPVKWEDVEMVMVQDMERKEFKIYTPNETSYIWVTGEEKDLSIYEKLALIGKFEYTAIDINGRKCQVQLSLFNEEFGKYDLMLTIKYSNVFIAYLARR